MELKRAGDEDVDAFGESSVEHTALPKGVDILEGEGDFTPRGLGEGGP